VSLALKKFVGVSRTQRFSCSSAMSEVKQA
jgi:hypothetical protein